MDLRQQAKNVAKAGRYGDSMLLHVNPMEMKGLRQSLPITKNPETGQDEAFLPFLAPLLGSMVAPALFTTLGGALGTGALGTALTTLGSKAALAGAVGSGLGTYAATGDLEKGLLSGLTGYGLGQALNKFAPNVTEAAVNTNMTDAATSAGQVLNPEAVQNITDLSTLAGNQAGQNVANLGQVDKLRAAFSPSISPEMAQNIGMQVTPFGPGKIPTTGTVGLPATAGDIAKGAMNTIMDPSVLYPTAIGATGTAMIEAEEEMAANTARLLAEEEERKKRIQEEYDRMIGAIQNPVGFQTGGFTSMEEFEKDYIANNPRPSAAGGRAGYERVKRYDQEFADAMAKQEELMRIQNLSRGFGNNSMSMQNVGFQDDFIDGIYRQGYGDFYGGPGGIDFPGLGNFPINIGDGFGIPGGTAGTPPNSGAFQTTYQPQGTFPPNYQGGLQGERVQIPRINPDAYASQNIGVAPFRPSYDPNYNAFFNAPFYSGIPAVINPYSSFNPLDFMGNVAMPVTPPGGPGQGPIEPPGVPLPPPPIQVPPIDPPIDVPPPITQPGGPGPIADPGKQPPGDFNYTIPEPPPPSIGGPGGGVGGGSLRPNEYDPLSDPRIFDLINQRIDERVEALGVPQEGFSNMVPRSDQDIQSLIDQSLQGFQPQQPAFNENELVDRLRNQFVSYDRLPDVIPQPSVGADPFDASDIYGQLGELRGQLSSLPQGGGRTDADIQALIDQSLQGFQPEIPAFDPRSFNPRSDEDIQGLIDQRLAGLEQPDFRDDFMSINQRIDDLYSRPGFDPSDLQAQIAANQAAISGIPQFDPSNIQNQIYNLQEQFEGFQPTDISGLQDQYSQLQNQLGQVQGQLGSLPTYDDQFMSINRRIDDISQRPGFDPSGLQQQISGLQDQFAGFQPFDPSGLQQDIGQLQGQLAGLPDFSQFAQRSDIQQFDPSNLQQQISGLQQDFAGFQPFDPSQLQSQISGLQQQVGNIPQFDPSGLQQQISGLQDQFAGFQPFDPSALQGQIGQIQGQLGALPDFNQFAMRSDIPSYDFSDFARMSDLPTSFDPSDLQSQISGLQNQFAGFQPFDPSGLQGQISGLQQQIGNIPQFDPTGLQSQISGLQSQFGGLPDFSQFAMRSDIPSYDFSNFARMSDIPTMPDMSNFITQQNLQSALSPFGGMQNQLNQFGYDIAGLQGQYNALPDFSQYALATQIPDVSNFVTSSGLANTLGPYAFRSEIPQFSTGGSQPYVQQPPVQEFPPGYRGPTFGRKEGGRTGFQEGRSTNVEENIVEGEVVETPELSQDVLDDPITKELMLFIAGDSEDDSIIQEFVTKYGPELFSQVRQMVLQQIMPNAQTEGMIKGSLEGGMADDIPMTIGADTKAAVSQDEYIVPADVVSMIGDGSSDAGAKKLDGMLDNVRLEKGGTTKQARPLKKNIEEYVQ